MTEAAVGFLVLGRAQPAGSKRAFPYRKGDKLGVRVSDANPKSLEWKRYVAACARDAMRGRAPLCGPLEFGVSITFVRPKGHFTKNGDVRQGAPDWPTVRPDATKLLRAIEDALTGIVWVDDAQIVKQSVQKLYGDADEVLIHVMTL